MLGLLAHTTHTDSPPPHTAGEGKRIARRAGLPYVLDWAPVLCLAVEREPGAHSFYRALASETRRVLFAENEPADPSASLPAPSGRGLRRASLASHARRSGHSAELELELESGLDPSAAPSPSLRSGSGLRLRAGSAGEEVSLRSIVHWLLCPARSGVFLSRARLGAWARGLDVPLPFGGRFDVGVSLFEAARVVDGTARLVDWLMAELEEWDAAYAAWSAVGWGEYAVAWRARIERAARMLANMKEALLSSLPP